MAVYQVKWGPKGFLVSPSKIVPFKDFTTSMTLKADSENDTSGTAPINTRGRELQPMTFSTTYLRAAGVDPRAQIEEWEGELGNSYPLYIGGKRFGPPKMRLTQVAVSDVVLSNKGEFLQATLAFTFAEDVGEKTAKVTASSAAVSAAAPAAAPAAATNSASASRAADVYAQTVANKKAALSATASKEDRNAKKLALKERRLSEL